MHANSHTPLTKDCRMGEMCIMLMSQRRLNDNMPQIVDGV